MRTFIAVSLSCLLLVLSGCARPSLHARKAECAPLNAKQLAVEITADARFKGPPGTHNCTQEYRALFHAHASRSANATDALPTSAHLEKLRSCKVLVVHGLLGEVGLGVRAFLDKFNREQGLIDYMKDQEDVFRTWDLPFQRVVFRSHRVTRSGEKIVEAILASDRPVLLFTHSKGCVDTLEALLQLEAQGKLDRVAGWISVQGPFYGSPQAERYVAHGGLRTFGIAAMRVMGGNFNAVRDLTPKARAAYMHTQRKNIEAIVKRVPLLCFTSWESPEKNMEAKDEKTADASLSSAFKIKPADCLLPGCAFVAKAGVSHSDPVISGPKPFNRDAFTRALLAMLAERMPEP